MIALRFPAGLVEPATKKELSQAESPLMGITPIMDWIRDHYDKAYAPNTRETIRRKQCTSSLMLPCIYNPTIRHEP